MKRRRTLLSVVFMAGHGLACGSTVIEQALEAGPAEPADAGVDGNAIEVLDDGGNVDAVDEGSTPSEEDADVGDAPSTEGCPISQTDQVPAHLAKSGGFSGADMAYFGLYGSACATTQDCIPACVAAGGTMDSCASGSQCLAGEAEDGGSGCLPPTYWIRAREAFSESGTTAVAAQLILVAVQYNDPLILSDFRVAIPDGATITGIRFQVQRATLSGNAIDGEVRLLKSGVPVGSNRAGAGSWSGQLAYASYGGAYDLWGASWTPADLRSSGFGISMTPKYTGPEDGNERAYVDSVRATVFYRAPCP